MLFGSSNLIESIVANCCLSISLCFASFAKHRPVRSLVGSIEGGDVLLRGRIPRPDHCIGGAAVVESFRDLPQDARHSDDLDVLHVVPGQRQRHASLGILFR